MNTFQNRDYSHDDETRKGRHRTEMRATLKISYFVWKGNRVATNEETKESCYKPNDCHRLSSGRGASTVISFLLTG